MAQLRDTVVAGSLRATDTLFSTTAQFQILRVPTSSNGTTFGPGSNNNLLKSNGTSVYWTTLVSSDIPTISITDKTSGTLPVTRGGTGVTTIANIQAGKDGDGNTISSTYLKLSGGTLTGDLNIRKNSAWTLSLNNDINSGRHGLKSSGFGQYDGGLSWVEDEAWLVYRDAYGNIILNGDCTGNATNVTGTVAVSHGGTGATTAAGARTNLGAAAASDVTHVYVDTGTISHPLDTSSYYISFETVGKNVYITFRGDNRTHAEDEVFMVIPAGYRSGGDRYFPAAINNVACGVVMRSNGNVSIWTPNPPSGRIFLSMAYCIE